MAKASKTSLIITSIICTTVILVAVIGAWVYVQEQNIAQKDRQLQQAKELKEYEQEQINKRNERDNTTQRIYNSDGQNPFMQ